VQVMGAVSAMQAARHDTFIVQPLLPPALAKNARTGHPFPDRERKSENVDHPPKVTKNETNVRRLAGQSITSRTSLTD
jgi:hypothetical protein